MLEHPAQSVQKHCSEIRLAMHFVEAPWRLHSVLSLQEMFIKFLPEDFFNIAKSIW